MFPCTWLMVASMLLGAALLLGGGCAEVRITDPARTATEQFLMTEAIAEAVDQLGVEIMRDRQVYVADDYLDVPQAAYLIAVVRARLLEEGVRLVETPDAAEIVVELRSRGVGIDRSENLIGLPPVLLPANTSVGGVEAGTLITPEIALYKKIDQRGFAAVAFTAHWRDSGELVGSAGPFFGYTRREDLWLFGIGPSTTGDIAPVRPSVDDAP